MLLRIGVLKHLSVGVPRLRDHKQNGLKTLEQLSTVELRYYHKFLKKIVQKTYNNKTMMTLLSYLLNLSFD